MDIFIKIYMYMYILGGFYLNIIIILYKKLILWILFNLYIVLWEFI